MKCAERLPGALPLAVRDELIEHAISSFAESAALRAVRLRSEPGGALPPVACDGASVQRVLANLVENALKFTPRGGRIVLTVAATPEGGQTLVVKDTGPGIPKEEIPRVMQAFGQGSLAHQTAEGGTGLGLPIAKALVELHGGALQIRSEKNAGTEVCVNLPSRHQVSVAQGREQILNQIGRP